MIDLVEPNGRHPDVLFMGSDASFGGNVGRKSSQGFVSFLYGGPVVWHANKQKSVTTSTTEAELVALSAAARELIALERFKTFLTHINSTRMDGYLLSLEARLIVRGDLQKKMRKHMQQLWQLKYLEQQWPSPR